jgi:hypothetical protein
MGLRELSVKPRKAYAPAVSDRTWSEQTKSLSLPSSDPSAAPAPISRHRFVLCRAVVMFDHRGVAPSTPNEGHNGFAGQMQEGHGKFVRSTRSNKQVSGVEPRRRPLTSKTKKPPGQATSSKLRVGRLRRQSPPRFSCERFDIRRIRRRRTRSASSPRLTAPEPPRRRWRTNRRYGCRRTGSSRLPSWYR